MRLVGHTTVVAVHKPSVTAVSKQLAASVIAASEPSDFTTSIVVATFGLVTVVEVGFADINWQLKVKRIKVRHQLMECAEELEEHKFVHHRCILVRMT